MKWLTLFTSLLLATCAAYFSIVGIMTIFAGAAFAVMIMATVLEIGKLVSTAWLHYEWDRINNLVRAYFIFAVLVLMFITSMGIFGYLSKAHIDQTIQVGGNNELKIEMLERKIAAPKTREVEIKRETSVGTSRTASRSQKKDTNVIEEISKNTMVRQIGRTIFRELTRNFLGSLTGKKR